MRLDNKGEGGFMEAMAAVMVVTVALTVFMGILVYSALPEQNENIDLNTEFLNSLKIVNGNIVGNIGGDLEYISQKENISMITVSVEIVGNVSKYFFSDSYGHEMTNNVSSKTGTISMSSDDGRDLIASYEVVYWY